MVKVKFCGIANLEDAILAEKLGADFLGFVTDTVSPRFVKKDFIGFVKRYVTIPTVEVIVKGNVSESIDKTKADLIQIHRVLTRRELDEIHMYRKKVILYVPSSDTYQEYFRSVMSMGFNVLVDSEIKGSKVNLDLARGWAKEYEIGIGGGISPDNLHDFLSINPKWIDVSSGIEKYKGKKDPSKMLKIIEGVRKWKYTQ
ncbi:N-(5'-phosphoribosyl)anthranilate isomerase [Sulfolobus acidocaldarius SUSAZ]|nr:N-(5'-phosphoribosyl)anthranilate isomerase [Sulfolobus acidocaldarius SUSAZ]